METLEKKYTVREFLEKQDFIENALYELINGIIVKRSSPSPTHQIILGKLLNFVFNFLKTNNFGSVFFAPINKIFY